MCAVHFTDDTVFASQQAQTTRSKEYAQSGRHIHIVRSRNTLKNDTWVPRAYKYTSLNKTHNKGHAHQRASSYTPLRHWLPSGRRVIRKYSALQGLFVLLPQMITITHLREKLSARLLNDQFGQERMGNRGKMQTNRQRRRRLIQNPAAAPSHESQR